jgi:uncharacterized protein (DUF1778 family)
MTAVEGPARRESLNIRIQPEDRQLIDQAALATGKTRTDFVLDAARRAATDTLLDRALILTDDKAHAAFLARLDEPPAPNDRLRRSLGKVPLWDQPA